MTHSEFEKMSYADVKMIEKQVQILQEAERMSKIVDDFINSPQMIGDKFSIGLHTLEKDGAWTYYDPEGKRVHRIFCTPENIFIHLQKAYLYSLGRTIYIYSANLSEKFREFVIELENIMNT